MVWVEGKEEGKKDSKRLASRVKSTWDLRPLSYNLLRLCRRQGYPERKIVPPSVQ